MTTVLDESHLVSKLIHNDRSYSLFINNGQYVETIFYSHVEIQKDETLKNIKQKTKSHEFKLISNEGKSRDDYSGIHPFNKRDKRIMTHNY